MPPRPPTFPARAGALATLLAPALALALTAGRTARAQDELAMRFVVGEERSWRLQTETWIETRLLGGIQYERATVVFLVRERAEAIDADGTATLACRFTGVVIDREAPTFGHVHFCAREHAPSSGEGAPRIVPPPPGSADDADASRGGVSAATARLFGRLPGQTFAMRLAADGRVLAVSGLERVRAALVADAGELGAVAAPFLATTLADGPLGAALASVLNVLPPAGAAAPGATWTAARRADLRSVLLGEADATATITYARAEADRVSVLEQSLSAYRPVAAPVGPGAADPGARARSTRRPRPPRGARFDRARGEPIRSVLEERVAGTLRARPSDASNDVTAPVRIQRTVTWERLR